MKSAQLAAKTKMPLAKKLIFGFAGMATVAVIGSAGIAAAQTSGDMPQQKADCVHWQDFGFKNKGQCVSWVEHHLMGHGYGYGGGGNDNQVTTDINVNVKGNKNVIKLVINYFFGS